MTTVSVVAGSAAALASSTVVLSIAMLAGFTGKISQWILAAGFVAVFVAVWLLRVGSSRRHEVAGASLALTLGVATVVIIDLGSVGWSLVVGAALAGALLWIRPNLSAVRPSGLAAVLVALAVVAFVITPLILDGGTLGHDESAYALKAKSWIDGTPATGWSLHRGIGMSVYAAPILRSGGGEAGLRSIGLVGTLALVGAVWLLGQRVANKQAAAIAAISVVAGPAILRRGSEYLSDIPSAALLVATMVVVWVEFETKEEGPSYNLLYAIPLALAAFYVRYQSILSLGLIAITTFALWWPKVHRRKGPIFSAVVVWMIGLVPHALFAVDRTGSPIGILLRTGGGAVREYLGQGLVDYGHQLLWPLAGFVAPIAVVLFVVGGLDALRHHQCRKRFLFLAVPALVQVLALGLISHGEPRFIFFPLALTLIVAATAAHNLARHHLHSLERAIAATLAVILVSSLGLSAAWARDSVAFRSESNRPVQAASEAISGVECGVLTSYLPQVAYYSGCSTTGFQIGVSAANQIDAIEGSAKHLILIDGGKNQPTGNELQRLVGAATWVPLELPGATIYSLPTT